MITEQQRAEIRRLYYAEHWKVGTIATQLGLHHTTVIRALELDRRPVPPRRLPWSILDEYKPFIAETLQQYPRLRVTRLLEMLRERCVVLATGQGRAEAPHESVRMSEVLTAKGIPHHLELWGHDCHHDWPTWRSMLPMFLDKLLPAVEA